jgi:hypothetical protein
MLACVQGLARTNIGDEKNARDESLDALPAATWVLSLAAGRDSGEGNVITTHCVFHMF